MKRIKQNRREFCVVKFIELPFEGIYDYICVPNTWLTERGPTDQDVAVAYPKDENPFTTRDRVKRKERYNDTWRFYMANVKYESDTYKDAEYWIATRNIRGPLVNEESNIRGHEEFLYETSSDEDTVEPKYDVRNTEITPGSSSANTPTTGQNSRPPNDQTPNRVVLEKQVLADIDTVFDKMTSTYRYMCDMHTCNRESIFEIAKTYKKLLVTVKRLHTVRNPDSNVSPTNVIPQEVPHVNEERHIADMMGASTSKENQHSYGDTSKAPKRKHNNLWRFVLPPNYDPNDTRWTLKYPKILPGLVELRPQSGIYVSYGDLIYCQKVSNECKSLARRLLTKVFNRKALSVCLAIDEKEQDFDNNGSNIRPKLDNYAITVLLNFVVEHGRKNGWNTDLKPILSTIDSVIKMHRFKYGIMVKC